MIPTKPITPSKNINEIYRAGDEPGATSFVSPVADWTCDEFERGLLGVGFFEDAMFVVSCFEMSQSLQGIKKTETR